MWDDGIKITKEGKDDKFGIFYDIDENGFLMLKTKSGIEKISFGDVSLR